MAFSPDGKTIASGSHDKTIKLWNLQTNQLIYTLSEGLSCPYALAFSPDGTIAIAGEENQVDVWDIEKREKIYTLTLEADNKIRLISVSKDGEVFFGSLNNDIIKIWNLLTGEKNHD
ncbi:WD40 repeat domain-containing protein [Nostoc sp.]|uniref:WD40 repeat domain-containing protein n=1 Tax=Nostoc sp. TaxID=1180 RepID=UPI003FA536FF